MPLNLNAAAGTYVNAESTSMISKLTAGIMAPFGDGSEGYTVKEVRFTALAYGVAAAFLGIRAGAKAQAAGSNRVWGYIPTGQSAR